MSQRTRERERVKKANDNLPPTRPLFIETYECLNRAVGSALKWTKNESVNECIHSQYFGKKIPFLLPESVQRFTQHFNGFGTNLYSPKRFSWTTNSCVSVLQCCRFYIISMFHPLLFSSVTFKWTFRIRVHTVNWIGTFEQNKSTSMLPEPSGTIQDLTEWREKKISGWALRQRVPFSLIKIREKNEQTNGKCMRICRNAPHTAQQSAVPRSNIAM